MYMSASQTVVITVQVEWKFPLLDREIAAKRAARCEKTKKTQNGIVSENSRPRLESRSSLETF